MTTIIEKDSSSSSVLMVLVVIILAGGALAFAYMNGMFGGKTTVIENNKTFNNTKTIEKTVEKPAPRAHTLRLKSLSPTTAILVMA